MTTNPFSFLTSSMNSSPTMSLAYAAVLSEPTFSAAASEATAVGGTLIISASGFSPAVRARAEAGEGEADEDDGKEASVSAELCDACGIVTVGAVLPIIVCRST